MQVLTINQAIFLTVFARDRDYHPYPYQAYLNRQDGEIVTVHWEDEDAHTEHGTPPAANKAMRNQVAAAPNRYLDIPGLSHGDHHAILLDFLASDWTDDDDAKLDAQAAYHGSIGRWKRTVQNDDARLQHQNHQYDESIRMAEAFLRKNGIEPHWI